MVFAIIGCVVAAIQMIVAAAGASRVKSRYGHVFGPSSCDDCSEVSVVLYIISCLNFGNSRWLSAAILKIVKSPYANEKSSDLLPHTAK